MIHMLQFNCMNGKPVFTWLVSSSKHFGDAQLESKQVPVAVSIGSDHTIKVFFAWNFKRAWHYVPTDRNSLRNRGNSYGKEG